MSENHSTHVFRLSQLIRVKKQRKGALIALALVFVATFIFCIALRTYIRRYPMVLYSLAAILVAGYFVTLFVYLPRPVHDALFLLMQTCALATALFTVVMFAGVFSPGSYLGSALRSIRAELSITAWILACGHMSVYLAQFLPRLLLGGSVKPQVVISITIAFALFILLLVLGITSIRVIKRQFGSAQWKRIQMLAYPFFSLIFIHLFIMLAPSALTGNTEVLIRLAVYSIVFVSYVVLRIGYALRTRKKEVISPLVAGGKK